MNRRRYVKRFPAAAQVVSHLPAFSEVWACGGAFGISPAHVPDVGNVPTACHETLLQIAMSGMPAVFGLRICRARLPDTLPLCLGGNMRVADD